MDFKILKLEVVDGIGIIKNSRPEALNALNSAFFAEMDLMLLNIKERNDIRVVVITGEGKAFAAGADIAEMVVKNQEEGKQFSRNGQYTFDSIENFDKPVIAAVNGFALGGGCELAMACDFRIASSKAKFGQPEVNLGLTPGYAGTQRLPRLVGMGNALYLLMTAEMITAEEALRIGLVQKVVEPEKLMEEVMNLARVIEAKGPKAIRKVKMVTRTGANLPFDQGCELETREFGSLFRNEGEEGMKAFLEKRKPEWPA